LNFPEPRLDIFLDTEPAFSSVVAYEEVSAEAFGFTTYAKLEKIAVAICIPFTVHRGIDGSQNGAVRIYIDEFTAGALVMNGGQWCSHANVPYNGRCSGLAFVKIPNIGSHLLYVRIATSHTDTIVTLRSRRRYLIF
jgi:hypothetical protein